MKALLKKLLRKLRPEVKQRIRRIIYNKWFFEASRKNSPLSHYHGFDRGTPVDRYYIERFLDREKEAIKGHVLEVLSNDYTLRFGDKKVAKSDILDIDPGNAHATIKGDLRELSAVQDDTFDCIILTQVFQFIDDLDSAIKETHRILKPGGVLLVTLPSISRIDGVSDIDGDYWRFTVASTKYLFGKYFANPIVTSEGNVRIGEYFWKGYAQEDIPESVFKKNDPLFPVIITLKSIKQ